MKTWQQTTHPPKLAPCKELNTRPSSSQVSSCSWPLAPDLLHLFISSWNFLPSSCRLMAPQDPTCNSLTVHGNRPLTLAFGLFLCCVFSWLERHFYKLRLPLSLVPESALLATLHSRFRFRSILFRLTNDRDGFHLKSGSKCARLYKWLSESGCLQFLLCSVPRSMKVTTLMGD